MMYFASGRIVNPAPPAASDRFGKFSPESERIVRMKATEPDRILEAMRWIFLSIDAKLLHYQLETYDKYSKALRGIPYEPKHVECFSIMLADFQDIENFPYRAGQFLSALINKGKAREFTIRTSHLDQKLYNLGLLNSKRVTVDGPGGEWCGYGMKRGSLIIRGDVGDYCGREMTGGVLCVEGRTNARFGNALWGGTIIIMGNAGWMIGQDMHDGEIHLEGGYEQLGEDRRAGRIFDQGKLIWSKERGL